MNYTIITTANKTTFFSFFAYLRTTQPPHIYYQAVGKNFFTLFLELLVGDALPPAAHAATITASFLLPWLAAAALSRVVETARLSLAET